jgi:hypothetical protein
MEFKTVLRLRKFAEVAFGGRLARLGKSCYKKEKDDLSGLPADFSKISLFIRSDRSSSVQFDCQVDINSLKA